MAFRHARLSAWLGQHLLEVYMGSWIVACVHFPLKHRSVLVAAQHLVLALVVPTV